MSETLRYSLKPKGPFHFGERGVGMEVTGMTLHSDSLFSAICLTLRDLKGSRWLEDEFLSAFLEPGAPPPVLISSLYPYAGTIYFLPRPMAVPRWRASADEWSWRKMAKAKFVSETVFSYLVEGKMVDDAILPGSASDRAGVFAAGTWVSRSEGAILGSLTDHEGQVRPWDKEQEAPRVTVDRGSSASDYFLTGRLSFHADAGLYFLARWAIPDHPLRAAVEEALASLGETGIGGERSAGYGQFDLIGPALADPLPDAGALPYFTTLSVYCPTAEEVNGGLLSDNAAYDLLTRRGWIASPQGGALRRKSVRMLGEGSILASIPGRDSYGLLSDTTPDVFDPAKGRNGHKVYRYGLAFPVGVSAQAVGEPGAGGSA